MANEAGAQGQGKNSDTAEANSAEGRATIPARRAYTAPRLTRLGEVRDLTFGSVGSNTEGPGQSFPARRGPRH
jgi:hypothetical protein